MHRWIYGLVCAIQSINIGCSEQSPNNTKQSRSVPVRPSVVRIETEGAIPPLTGDPVAEMAKLTRGESEEIDLRVAQPTPDELRQLPQLPNVKEITIRSLKVTHEHLDALGEKCPNVEMLDLFGVVVSPELLSPIRKFKSLKHLDIGDDELNDAALAPLQGLPLVSLHISNTAVTDDGLDVVGSLVMLKKLGLGELKLTDAGIKHLGSLTRLESLDLGYSEITDASLQSISKMHALTSLSLDRTHITDTGVAALATLKELNYFSAHCPGITDPSMEVIAGWPQIETISLWDAQITDAGLKLLSRSATLRNIHIGRTKVTNAGLPHLYTMKLLNLNLSGTETTQEGIEKLKMALPDLAIRKYGKLQ